MATFDGRVCRSSFASMLSTDIDHRDAARLRQFHDRGVADARAGEPLRCTLEHLGGLYFGAEGDAYQRGWWSVEHKRRKHTRRRGARSEKPQKAPRRTERPDDSRVDATTESPRGGASRDRFFEAEDPG